MSNNQYDDSAKGGYTYEEKLQLVSDGLMDPKEIGLPPAEEGQAVARQSTPPTPRLGDFIEFKCSEVPIGIRAQWARQELTIQPANPRGFEADWIEEHANECLIRGVMHTGNQKAMLERLTIKGQMQGMIDLMRETVELLETKYAELQNAMRDPEQTEDKANE